MIPIGKMTSAHRVAAMTPGRVMLSVTTMMMIWTTKRGMMNHNRRLFAVYSAYTGKTLHGKFFTLLNESRNMNLDLHRNMRRISTMISRATAEILSAIIHCLHVRVLVLSTLVCSLSVQEYENGGEVHT